METDAWAVASRLFGHGGLIGAGRASEWGLRFRSCGSYVHCHDPPQPDCPFAAARCPGRPEEARALVTENTRFELRANTGRGNIGTCALHEGDPHQAVRTLAREIGEQDEAKDSSGWIVEAVDPQTREVLATITLAEAFCPCCDESGLDGANSVDTSQWAPDDPRLCEGCAEFVAAGGDFGTSIGSRRIWLGAE